MKTYLTQNFTFEELRCPCCHEMEIDEDFLDTLQDMRDELGQPCIVTSGFRCEEHNRDVGGALRSQHMSGLAIDIHCIDARFRYDLIKAAMFAGFTGIIANDDYLHLDLREDDPLFLLY